MKNIFLILITVLFSFFMSAQIIKKPVGSFAGSNGTHPLVLSNPDVRGVLLSYKWKDIETTPGVYDFSSVNTDISTVTGSGLSYTLAFLGGAFGSPDWLIDSLGADFHSFSYQSSTWRLPLWWDSIVQNKLDLLISKVGIEYAQDTMLSHVYVTQMTTNGVEGHLNGVDMTSFATDGYTAQKWIDAAKNTTYKFTQAFPDKPIVFEVHEIENDTVVPATIMNNLYQDPSLCERVGLGMWWISGKTTYQTNLINYIDRFKGDKYAQIIGRSDQTYRFKDSNYNSVFTQAKNLDIRYIEPWPYEFQYHTYDSIIQNFNQWADSNFSPIDTCSNSSSIIKLSLASNQINIYPNPTQGQINLDIPSNYQNIVIQMFDTKGQEIYQIRNENLLNIQNIENGIYYISINIDDVIYTKKIIKI